MILKKKSLISFFRLFSLLSILKEDAQEEFGWKLVHGDVFRPPRYALFLSVFVGSGCQILAMVAITLGVLSFVFKI